MLKKIIFFILALAVLIASVATLDFFTGYEVHRDVAYADKEQNRLDIYIPNDASERSSNGVVLFIHGGSWSGGDKSDETFRCRLLASQGYVAATLNYTLWTEDTKYEYNVLSVIDEIDAALSEIVSYTKELGVTIDKAGIAGYSAGAHLAMLYAYSRHDTAPVGIVFVSAMSGPAEISEEVWGADMAVRVGRRLTGVEITEEMLRSGEADALLKSVSPTSYIDTGAPETLIMHGGRDTVVPIANAEALIKRLDEKTVKYDYVYMPLSTHTLLANPLKHVKYAKMLINYCQRHFRY